MVVVPKAEEESNHTDEDALDATDVRNPVEVGVTVARDSYQVEIPLDRDV